MGLKFCGHCGARLTDSSLDGHESPTISTPYDELPSAERRQCTVLSTSLSGYAALIEKLPPHDITFQVKDEELDQVFNF